MDTEDYLIHELAEKVGISVRTIRYYISEGLLPTPDTKGRYNTFTEEYRLRLELILKLKESFLPLKEIRDRIAGLDPSEIRQLLDQLKAAGTGPEPDHLLQFSNDSMIREGPLDSALEYLAGVMDEQEAAKTISRKERRSISPAPSIPPQRRPATEVETWQRITLAPGLELHIRPSEEPFYRERIRQIVEFAKIQFS